jgi:hypothetical protein
MIYKKIRVDVYGRTVWITRDIETAKRLVWKQCGRRVTDEDFCCKGFTANGFGNNVVWLHEDSWVHTLAHEMTHVALNIFHYAGVDVDANNQEPTAYLVGYLTGAAFYWMEAGK